MASNTVGIAYLTAMCFDHDAVGVVLDKGRNIQFLGATAAHELGHLLNMRHDDSCTLPHSKDLSMAHAFTIYALTYSTLSLPPWARQVYNGLYQLFSSQVESVQQGPAQGGAHNLQHGPLPAQRSHHKSAGGTLWR